MGNKELSSTFIQRWGVGVMICIWYASSVIGNNAGKVVLPLFPYPYSLSIIQFGLGAASVPTLYYFKGYPVQPILSIPRTFFNRGVFLGVTGITSNLFHRIALMYISVSFSHTIKATQPLFSAVLSYFLLGHRYSMRTVGTLLVVVAGVAMSAMTEFDFNIIGFTAAAISAFSMSVANTVQKSFMRKAKVNVNIPLIAEVIGQPQASSFDQNELFFLTNFFSLCMMLPFWWFIDGHRMFKGTIIEGSALVGLVEWETPYVMFLVLANTVPNVTQHFSSLAILNLLSPVSHSLANSCKRVIVIALSVIYFRNPVSLLNFIGMACALGGVFAYQKSVTAERDVRRELEAAQSSALQPIHEEEQQGLLEKQDSAV